MRTSNLPFLTFGLQPRLLSNVWRCSLLVLKASSTRHLRRWLKILVVMADPFLISGRDKLVELASLHAIPAIYQSRMFADIGGLMSYGGGLADLNQQPASMSEKFSRAPTRLTSPSNRAPKLNS
jgi:hypothetical protein